MENYLFLLFGVTVSCLINSIIIFQFIEERYERVYPNKKLYALMQTGTCLGIIIVNLFEIPILNMISWLAIFGIIVGRLYTEYGKKRLERVLETVILILVLTVCETVGCVLLEFAFWKLKLTDIQPSMMQCLSMTFSKMIIIVFYYAVISRIWKPRTHSRFTATQYIVHAVIIIYSVINLAVIIVVVSNEMAISFVERLLLLVNMFCIVFADLFFLYFTKFTEENGKLKLKLNLLEQQSDLQYEYYAAQEDKYEESIKILHDVNKHLKMIKEIYETDKINEAREYADEIERILKPLIIYEYTNNPILNILLNDKKRSAALHNIDFQLDIGQVDLGFMEPIEITTLFGNLIDNAIEAAEDVLEKDRFIKMRLDSYNDFVVIQISNSSLGKCKWNNGKPISNRGKNHGIGVLNAENVVKRYDGSLLLKENKEVFCCNIIFNS